MLGVGGGRLRAFVLFVVGTLVVSLAAAIAWAPSSSADATTGTGGLFVPVQGRILDTRSGTQIGPYTGPLPANTWKPVDVTGTLDGAIPDTGVAAVALNFTVVNNSSDGMLKADKNETTPNSIVTYLHWAAGVPQSNSGVVTVGADGKIQVELTTSANLMIDVQGYYTSGDPAEGGFVPVTQTRIVDTRNGTGLPAVALSTGTVTITVAGSAGVPSDASAVMADFQVLNQSGGGYITPYPADEASPPQQSLNYGNGGTDATTVAVGLSTSGTPLGALDVYTHPASGSIDLTIDILGYFTATRASGAFTPAAARVYDSRWSGNTTLAGGASRTIPIAGQAGVPANGIGAAVVNIATLNDNGTASGYLRALPSGGTESVSDLAVQYPAGGEASNMLTLALGADGGITVHNMAPSGSIDIVVFVEGWYANALPLFTPAQKPLANSTTGTGGLSSALVANTWTTIDVVGDGNLPQAGVGSVALTFTVVGAAGSGHIEGIADGATPSGLGLLDFDSGQRVSGSAVVALSSAGKIQVMASASTNLMVDLQGYYSSGIATTGGYVPLNPTVVASTIDGTGGLPSALTTGTTASFAVTGTGLAPTTAASVELLVSEDDSTTSSGSLSVYPASGSIPTTTLSWPGGHPTAWTVVVALDETGRVAVNISAGGPISLTISAEGYYTSATGASDTRTFSAQESRVADTRQFGQGGPLLGGETRSIQIAGEAGIPSLDEMNTTLAVIDVRAIATTGSPAGVLNISAGDATLNGQSVSVAATATGSTNLVVPLGPNGDINVTNISGASADAVVDVEGLFAASEPFVATPPTTAVVATMTSTTTTDSSDSTTTQPSETDAELTADIQTENAAYGGAPSATTITHADGTISTTDGATSADPNWTDVAADDGQSANDSSAPADPNFDSSQTAVDSDVVATSDVATTTGSFAGTPDTGVPPADPTVARINNRIVETVNSVLKVYDANTHAVLYQRSLKKLFGVVRKVFDPHVIVVPSRKRFAIVASDKLQLLVLYSKDSYFNTWCHAGFPQQNGDSNLIDFPLIGASEKYLYMTSNLLHSETDGSERFVTNATTQTSLSELQQCNGTSTYHNTYGLKDPQTGILSRTIAPSVNYVSTSGPYVYLVSKYQNNGSDLVVHYILDRDPSKVYGTTAKVRNYYTPHDVSQPDIQSKIEANTGEPFQVAINNFGAYTAMTTWDPNHNVDATRVMTFGVDFSSNHVTIDTQRNIVFGNGYSALYPSTASDANGDTVVSSVLFGPNGYEKIAVVVYNINFQVVSTIYPQIASTSYAMFDCTLSTCPNSRWGDFSSVQPTGNGNFILVQQTVRSLTHWGTRIVEVHT